MNTIQYYVIRNTQTKMYFRGKGANRWGQYLNQATIYRIRGTAESSLKDIERRHEQAEIVPIYIAEGIIHTPSKMEQSLKKITHSIHFMQNSTEKMLEALVNIVLTDEAALMDKLLSKVEEISVSNIDLGTLEELCNEVMKEQEEIWIGDNEE